MSSETYQSIKIRWPSYLLNVFRLVLKFLNQQLEIKICSSKKDSKYVNESIALTTRTSYLFTSLTYRTSQIVGKHWWQRGNFYFVVNEFLSLLTQHLGWDVVGLVKICLSNLTLPFFVYFWSKRSWLKFQLIFSLAAKVPF